MKKTALTSMAVALLGAWSATSASAQTNVSIYGLADACVAVNRAGSGFQVQLNGGCAFGSRLGFRGQEDIGSGLKAHFTLESGFSVDNGALGQGGRLFGRKALVGLSGGLGTIEFGRDYAPTFYLIQPVDPFRLGMGTASSTISTAARPDGAGRNDNAVVYTSPVLGGFTAKLQYALGETGTGATRQARDAAGLLVSYRSGPAFAGVAYNSLRNATDTGSDKVATIGGSYDFGFVKPAFLYQSGKWEGTRTAAAPSAASSMFSRDYSSLLLGATIPVGSPGSFIAASYKRYDDKTASNFDAAQVTLGYIHALSKRTELYTAYSRLSNRRNSSYAVVDATTTYGPVKAGYDPSTLFLGITHRF